MGSLPVGEAGRGGGRVGINGQRTIQCESFGNPSTAAGPNARAVFMPAPVYGTANLNLVSVREVMMYAIPCCEARYRARPGIEKIIGRTNDKRRVSSLRRSVL